MNPENEDNESEEGESSEKMGFSADGGMFFGTSASEKKSLRRTRDPRKIDPLRDLDLNAAPRKAPARIGETVRLIDLAMGDDFVPAEDGGDGGAGERREASADDGGSADDAGSDSQSSPESKPLADHSQALPGRAARPFAARSTGRTFVTSEEARHDPAPRTGTRRMVVLKQDEVGRRALPGRDSAAPLTRVPMPGRAAPGKATTPIQGGPGRPPASTAQTARAQPGPQSNGPPVHAGPHALAGPPPGRGPSSTGRASQPGLRMPSGVGPPMPGKPIGRPPTPSPGSLGVTGDAHGASGPGAVQPQHYRAPGRTPASQASVGAPGRGPGPLVNPAAQGRATPSPQTGSVGPGPKPGPGSPQGAGQGHGPGPRPGRAPGSDRGSDRGAARGPQPGPGPGPNPRPRPQS